MNRISSVDTAYIVFQKTNEKWHKAPTAAVIDVVETTMAHP